MLPVLDAGEREAIILASEQNADLLMMDDLTGRRAAMMYGINVMGTCLRRGVCEIVNSLTSNKHHQEAKSPTVETHGIAD